MRATVMDRFQSAGGQVEVDFKENDELYRELITRLAGMGKFGGVPEELDLMLDYPTDVNVQDTAIYYYGRWIARNDKRDMRLHGETTRRRGALLVLNHCWITTQRLERRRNKSMRQTLRGTTMVLLIKPCPNLRQD